jgi:hypothetical protein
MLKNYKYQNTISKKMKKNTIAGLALATLIIMTACGGKKADEKTDGAKENAAAETKATAAPAATKTEKGAVSFKVNGVDANTKMGGSNDNSEQLGMFNRENNYFSLTLNGDDPKFPHRGYLTIGIENYNMQPGEFKSTTASFSRYETANAGGETQYDVNQGGNCTIKIESITKTSAETDSFEEYAVSGSFSGKFGMKQGWNNDVKEINVTDGVFKEVRVTVFGRKK